MDKTALIMGASGIAGSATAAQLLRYGWHVEGLARNPVAKDGVVPIVADIEDRDALAAALAGTLRTRRRTDGL